MQTLKIEPFKENIRLTLKFYRKLKADSPNYGDADNHIKAVADALNGICYVDDRQIVSVSAEKLTDRIRPRTEITIDEIK